MGLLILSCWIEILSFGITLFQVNECEISPCQGTAKDNPVHDEQCKQEYCDNNDYLSIQLDESKAHQCVRSGRDESTSGEP